VSLRSAIKNFRALFPAFGGQGLHRGGIADWITWNAGQDYDYVAAAGELHRNGVCMACAAWIMRAFPEPALQVVKEERETGEENEVPGHPLTLALRRPNDFYGSDCLWQRVVFDRCLHGQAFIYKERNAAGKIIALWHIPQHRLMPQWPPDGKTFIDHFLFTVDQRQERIPTRDLVHFRFAGDPHHERSGLASLGAGLREIAQLNEGANYRGALLRNMGVPSHIIQGKDPTRPISAEQARQLHALWAERVSGSNRGKPIIPNWAIEAVKIGMSPAELDLGSMTYESADLICSLFGLSSMVVGISSGSEHKTYANYREAKEGATENALVPAWKQIAQDLTLQLLPDYGGAEDEMVAFDTSKVRALQEDQTQLWGRIDSAIKTGWVQINEGRALVNLPPVEGGDVFLPNSQPPPLDLAQQGLAPGQAGFPAAAGAVNQIPSLSTNPNGAQKAAPPVPFH
jgi:HK97 family phage portal protein